MRTLWTLVFIVGLTALACGPQAQPAPQSTDGTPKSGGTLVIRETTDLTNFDPSTGLQGEAKYVGSLAYSGLLSFKSGPGVGYEDQILEPQLAERWEVSPDAKTYTFHLRKGVKFANLPPVNGRELTSADVKFSFEYISRLGEFKDKKFRGSNQILFKLEGIQAIDASDPYTAVLRFKDGFAPFLTYAGTPDLAVMPKEIYEKNGDFSDLAVGSGPYIYDAASSQSGSRQVWKKNPDYWEKGLPYVDELRALTIIEAVSAQAAFQTKQMDILLGLKSTDADNLRKNSPSATIQDWLGDQPLRIYYNVNRPPFNDLNFRKAMARAVDRDEFVKALTHGKGQWAAAGVDNSIFTPEELKQMQPYDPEAAKQFLKQSGYNGVELDFDYTTEYGEELLNALQILQAQEKKVGINIAIKTMDRTLLSARRRQGDYTFSATGGGVGSEPDVDVLIFSYFHPSGIGGNNYYHLNDPATIRLVEATRREGDPVKRKEAIRQAARYVNDNVYGMWIYQTAGSNFWQSYVKNYAPNRSDKRRIPPDVWLDK